MTEKKPKASAELSLELRTMGPRLRQMRERLGWDRQELEQRAGVSSGRVSRLEKGDRLEKLTVEVVIKLAHAMGGNIAWLITGEGEMFAPETRHKRDAG